MCYLCSRHNSNRIGREESSGGEIWLLATTEKNAKTAHSNKILWLRILLHRCCRIDIDNKLNTYSDELSFHK